MNKTLLHLLIAQAALFSVQPAAPLIAVSYCMSATSEQTLVFGLWTGLIFILTIIIQSIIITWLYHPVKASLDTITDHDACPDSVIVEIARINSALPLRLSILFFFSIFASCAANYIVYRATSIGAIASASIWGGTMAGAIACPFMVLGTTSLILEKNTEIIAKQLHLRKLAFIPRGIGIFPKLTSCFIGFALGLSIWLGSAAFYTGINQTIEEITYGDAQWLNAVVSSIEQKQTPSTAETVFQSLSKRFPDRHLFLSDRSGKLLAGSYDDSFEIKRWTAQKKQLTNGLASGRQGAVYENINERVISWAPFGEAHQIGTFSYLNERLGRYTQFFIWSGIFILVGLVVGMALAITNVLATSRSINQAADALQDLAEGEGDLTVRLAISSEDEVGALARRFNTFTDKLYGIVKSVVETSGQIQHSSTYFSDLSQKMNIEIEELQQDTSHASHASGQTSRELTTVSSGCEETALNVNHVSAAAEEMAMSVQEVAQRSEEARQIAENAKATSTNASDKIQELGSAAKGIDKVTEVITEISEQINLLALNATIESARAGEAGKGFAVVANEIKELARQTAQATNEIKERIAGIQQATDDTVRDMDSISKVIGSVNDFVHTIAGAVEEQAQTTRDIALNIAHASSGISDVNGNVARCAETSRNMSSQMEQVHIKTENISQNSMQVDDSARKLLSISEQLKEQLLKFKL